MKDMYDIIKRQLKRDEGFRAKPYHDTVGKLTIGYGRNLDDTKLSESIAEAMLAEDVATAESTVRRIFGDYCAYDMRINEKERYAVLVNMAFNMGETSFRTFKKFIHHVQRKDWKEAADEMKDSRWYTQVGARADRLIEQMLTGKWR